MFEAGKQYKTRSGLQARVYAGDGSNPHWIHGAILLSEGWFINAWTKNGRCNIDGREGNLDLMPPVETYKACLNVYPRGFMTVNRSKELADQMALNSDRIAYIEREITFTPGEGLDK